MKLIFAVDVRSNQQAACGYFWSTFLVFYKQIFGFEFRMWLTAIIVKLNIIIIIKFKWNWNCLLKQSSITAFLLPCSTWIYSSKSGKKQEKKINFETKLSQFSSLYPLKNFPSRSSVSKAFNKNSLLSRSKQHWQLFLNVQRQQIPISLINGPSDIFKMLRHLIAKIAKQIDWQENQTHYGHTLQHGDYVHRTNRLKKFERIYEFNQIWRFLIHFHWKLLNYRFQLKRQTTEHGKSVHQMHKYQWSDRFCKFIRKTAKIRFFFQFCHLGEERGGHTQLFCLRMKLDKARNFLQQLSLQFL